MNLMGLFRSPQNELEKGGKQLKNPQEEQHEITMTCPKCGTQTPVSELWDDLNVCRCGHHFRMTASASAFWRTTIRLRSSMPT